MSTLIINKINNDNIEELDVKRLYPSMLGLEIIQNCPKCDSIHKWEPHFGNYFSYITLGKKFEKNLYCSECDYEWVEILKISVAIEIK